jgi:hypothetical protein
LRDQTIAVFGTNPIEIQKFVFKLGKPDSMETELSVHLGGFSEGIRSGPARQAIMSRVLDPYTDGARLLADIINSVQTLSQAGPLARVIMGDIRALRLFSAQEDMTRSLMILSLLLRDANIPLILFDSSGPRFSNWVPVGNELPLIADFADVQIIGWSQGGNLHVTATQGAKHRVQWEGAL